jgi:hypothetical protein
MSTIVVENVYFSNEKQDERRIQEVTGHCDDQPSKWQS